MAFPCSSSVSRLIRLRLESLEPRIVLSSFPLSTTDPLYLKMHFAEYRPQFSQAVFDFPIRPDVPPNNQALNYKLPGAQIAAGDFNGDGLTDLALFTSNGNWTLDQNRDGYGDLSFHFGQTGDIPLLGDVGGDGKGDLIVYRPSTGEWLWDNHGNGIPDGDNTISNIGNIPLNDRIPIVGDFNGDGRLDRAIYVPNAAPGVAAGTWVVDFGFSGKATAVYFFGGAAGDQPFVADLNDDKVGDLGILRSFPGQDQVLVDTTKTNTVAFSFFPNAQPGDLPIPGFYFPTDQLHTSPADYGTYDKATGKYLLQLTQGGFHYLSAQVGDPTQGDILTTGDINGDTVTDMAVYRPTTGTWTIDLTEGTTSQRHVVGFGGNGAVPLLGDVNGDGRADLIAFNPATAQWQIDTNSQGNSPNPGDQNFTNVFGAPGDIPVVGDFNGDGFLDRAVYRPGTGDWIVQLSIPTGPATFISAFVNGSGVPSFTYHFGDPNSGDVPTAFDFNGDGKTDLALYRPSSGVWFIDTTRDAAATLPVALQAGIFVQFGGGSNTIIPVPGYYDTGNSIFVSPGSAGNGSFLNPTGSITNAVNMAPDGAFLRLGPGQFTESVGLTAVTRNNLTFVGDTRLITSIAPATSDALFLQNQNNIYISGISFRAQDQRSPNNTETGRGLVVLGSRVFVRSIDTLGNSQTGILVTPNGVKASILTLADSLLDFSQLGPGLWSRAAGSPSLNTVRIRNTHADANGTAGRGPIANGFTQLGRGFVLEDATSTLFNVSGDFNNGEGLDADGGGDLLVMNSDFSNNPYTDGGFLAAPLVYKIVNCSFDSNGTPGAHTVLGAVGLEFDDFTGAGISGTITNSIFSTNQSSGIFAGNIGQLTVTNSTFYNNFVGAFLQSDSGLTATATFTGDSFALPNGNTQQSEGITAKGAGCRVTVGGAATSDKNTFTNFNPNTRLQFAIHSDLGAMMFPGDVQSFDSSNIFVNCPPPHFVKT